MGTQTEIPSVKVRDEQLRDETGDVVRARHPLVRVITVQIDTRERYPVPFPATIRIESPEVVRRHKSRLITVKTERIKLDYGDYRLKEFPDCCVIERKGSQGELFKNLFDPKDIVRQAKSLRKLMTCRYPYLLVEASPADLLKHGTYGKIKIVSPELLVHRLTLVLAKYGMNILWIPWSRSSSRRRMLGTFLAHLMLSCATKNQYDILPEILDYTKVD